MTNIDKKTIQLGGKQIKIEYVLISSLRPAEYNPRIHLPETIEKTKDSIRKHGFCDPAIANSAPGREGVTIGGHMRIIAARELGYETVPVVFLNIPDLEKEKALNISLNAISGEWDFEKLKDWDFGSLVENGFDGENLSAAWDSMLETEDDDFSLERDLPEAQKTQIKLGDRFKLGDHVLICGDSTDPATVKLLVGKEKISMIDIDMQYNIGLDYNRGVGGKAGYGGTVTDNKSDKEYEAFVSKIFNNALSVASPDVHCMMWCDERYIGLFQKVYRDSGINPLRVCYWLKNGISVTPNVAFNKCLEACVYGYKGKPFLNPSLKNLHELMNKELGTGNQLADDVLDHLNIWLQKRDAGQSYNHSAQKPISLHERALRRCSKVGDTVLDLCVGSGSLLLACQMLRRRAFVADIEPVFCQLTINRFEKATNIHAIKIN
jgi:hypothetical protein